MDLALTLFVALGLLVALWPWLLLGMVAAVMLYVIWMAIRRRRGHLD